jgi:hypothetical protein
LDFAGFCPFSSFEVGPQALEEPVYLPSYCFLAAPTGAGELPQGHGGAPIAHFKEFAVKGWDFGQAFMELPMFFLPDDKVFRVFGVGALFVVFRGEGDELDFGSVAFSGGRTFGAVLFFRHGGLLEVSSPFGEKSGWAVVRV